MASQVVFLVASQVGLAREVSGGNPRSLNSQHQDGLVRAVSGDSHSLSLSSLSLPLSQSSLSSLPPSQPVPQ